MDKAEMQKFKKDCEKLSNSVLLHELKMQAGNLALAKIGVACDGIGVYQEKTDFIIGIALKKMGKNK